MTGERQAAGEMTAHDWLQIEAAAAGCVSGDSDEWPHLRAAIIKLTGDPNTFHFRKCAAWLRGFCAGVMAMRHTD